MNSETFYQTVKFTVYILTQSILMTMIGFSIIIIELITESLKASDILFGVVFMCFGAFISVPAYSQRVFIDKARTQYKAKHHE